MPSLISDAQKVTLTGALYDHFDTFARNIIIYKKATAAPTVENNPAFPGYSDASNFPDTIYTYHSGIYPAVRVIKNDQEIYSLDEVKAQIVGKGKVRIKVREDAKNFIENGANERVEVDGMSFNFSNVKYPHNYLGLITYIYHIDAIN